MRRPKAEEFWPWADPGQKEWWPNKQSPMEPTVDHYDAQVTGVLLGPDGEPLIVQTDERTFGFARWLEEEYEYED